MRKLAFAAFVLALLFPLAAAAQQPPPPPQDTAAPQITIPAYSDSSDGLKQLVSVLVEAAKSNDQKTLAAYAQSLRLPDPDVWFRDVFGEVPGTQIAEAHGASRDHLLTALFEGLSAVNSEQFTDLKILRFERPCEPATDAIFYSILLLRHRPVPFYLAQFTKPGESSIRSTGFFTYVRGAFRYLGVIRVDTLRALPGSKVIRQGGNVQQAKLVKQARPHYPLAARDNGIHGTVRLYALVRTDGTIGAIQVLGGSCVLAEEAIKAVSQWRYNPTLLNGEPVVVATTIDVVFTLGR